MLLGIFAEIVIIGILSEITHWFYPGISLELSTEITYGIL